MSQKSGNSKPSANIECLNNSVIYYSNARYKIILMVAMP